MEFKKNNVGNNGCYKAKNVIEDVVKKIAKREEDIHCLMKEYKNIVCAMW